MSDIAASNDPLPKNIVLLSDGTGNSSSKIFKTNVWRLFQALDLTNPDEQVAYYDDGVGTSSFKWWAAITGVLGIGLKRNVMDSNFTSEDGVFDAAGVPAFTTIKDYTNYDTRLHHTNAGMLNDTAEH